VKGDAVRAGHRGGGECSARHEHARRSRVEGVVKLVVGTTALAGVSFTVAPGRVVGFLGPNGAGKTTTLRMIAGFLAADAGRAWGDGIEVGRDPVEAQRGAGGRSTLVKRARDLTEQHPTVCAFVEMLADRRLFARAGATARLPEWMMLMEAR